MILKWKFTQNGPVKYVEMNWRTLLTAEPEIKKRVLLNETPEFPFWGLNICVDFDLRD